MIANEKILYEEPMRVLTVTESKFKINRNEYKIMCIRLRYQSVHTQHLMD